MKLPPLNLFHRPNPWLRVALFLSLLLFTGCAGQQPLFTPLDEALDDNSTEKAAEALLASDPKGSLPQPQLPPELAAASPARPVSGKSGKNGPKAGTAAQGAARAEDAAPVVEYTVRCESPDAPELAAAFLASGTLERMRGIPLSSIPGLEQRLKTSLKEGEDILHSFGYYAGSVHGHLEVSGPAGGSGTGASAPEKTSEDAGGDAGAKPPPMTAVVTFEPGPRYMVGKTSIIRLDLEARAASAPQPPIAEPDDAASRPDTGGPSPATAKISAPIAAPPPDAPVLPTSLEDVGLAPESPAIAEAILAAVDRARDAFRNRGYPEATVTSSRFFLDHESRRLEAEIRIQPGPFMRMGPVTVQGISPVSLTYLEAKQTWEKGEPWNQDKVEAYRDALRQTGLFLSIDLDPATAEDASGNRPVLVALEGAPERTVGGAVKYDTSFGPGLQAYWEHRNVTGRGDTLRLELPVWADMQEFTAKYRLPYFLRPDQDFIAQAGLLNQNLDAYSLQAGRAAAGLERRLSRYWSVSVQGSAEGGSIKDPDKPRSDYMMLGLPLGASYDSTNSLLNATRGGRAVFSLAPFTGEYEGNFTALRSRVDLQRFEPLVGEDTLVLALRASVGALSGVDAQEAPPSIRFYSGGGGSVRGYAYQSLGPRNDDNDPLGGSGLLEVSIEPRFRLSEQWGLVAFLDGGAASDTIGELSQDLRWGAGVGVRFYTAIGPVRFDVATPLNPRDDDEPLQFYISIGQSF